MTHAGSHVVAAFMVSVVASHSASAKVLALIAKDQGQVVVSIHDGDRLRWWNFAQTPPLAPPFQVLRQEFQNCGVSLYEQRLRWTASGHAELLCSHRAWRFDGVTLSWWEVPHHQGNFDTGITPLPGLRIAYCESPTPHGGTSPYCAQFRDDGDGYQEICRDKGCGDRYLGATVGFQYHLRNRRVLLDDERLQLFDERTGERLFYVGDSSVYEPSAMVSPDEKLLMTSTAPDSSGVNPGAAMLWSLRNGSRVQRIPGKIVWGAFSPDTRRLAVFVGTELRTYALHPFRLLATIKRTVPATAVAWSDDGLALFVGDVNDVVERVAPLSGASR